MLGQRCRQLEAGLDNLDNDPRLVFDDLRYRDVLAVALRDPVVARVVGQLPDGFRWADE